MVLAGPGPGVASGPGDRVLVLVPGFIVVVTIESIRLPFTMESLPFP